MSTYIFSTFWPILKVLQILGLFPIKKSSENVCGFQAMPTGKYLVLTATVLTIGFVFYFTTYFLVMSKHDLGLLEFLHTMISLNGSPLDDVTYFGIIIVISMFDIGLVIGIFLLKSQIIELLEIFQGISMHVTPKNLWKSKSMLLLLAIAWITNPILATVAWLMRLIDHINVDISTSILFSMLHCVSLLVVFAGPVCSFLMLFSEPCYQLNAWMKSLIQIVESKEQSDQKIIYECKKFYYKGKQLKLIGLAHIPHLIITAHLTIELFVIKV